MPVLREWLRRLWGTFRKVPEDAVMEEELRLHLEMVAADVQRVVSQLGLVISAQV